MAATDNIGTTKKTLTQREFFKNMFEFFSATTLTDAVVDEKAPAVIENGQFFSSWPTGQGYEPTKCLPKFAVNKTISGNTTFWKSLKDIIADSHMINIKDKPYTSTNSPYNFKYLETNQLIPHQNIDTPFETTARLEDFKFKFNVSYTNGLSSSDTTYRLYMSASTLSNSGSTTDTLWSARYGNFVVTANTAYLTNVITFSDVNNTITPYIGMNLGTSATTTSSTFPIPLMFESTPTFTDDRGVTWTREGHTIGPTSAITGYTASIYYPSAITYANFPSALTINVSLTRAGNKHHIYTNRLIGKTPNNVSGIYFGSSMSIGQICVYPTCYGYDNGMEWLVATESAGNGRYNFGAIQSPTIVYNKTEEWEEDRCFHIHTYGCSSLTSATTSPSMIPRYVIQLPNSLWLMPLSASTTSAGTASNHYYGVGGNRYVTEANLYIAKQLKIVDYIYLDGVSYTNGVTYDYLVPPSFTFYHRASSNKTVIFKIDGVQIYSKTVAPNVSTTYTWEVGKGGGTLFEISY